jgi:hypothetical protein
MKTLRFAFLLVLFVGCASSQRKIGGRYGVIVGDRVQYGDQIVRALRDQLSSVDVVASPAYDAYDAVIVVDWGKTTLGPSERSLPTKTTMPGAVDPYVMPVGARFNMLHFAIHRGGGIAAEGTAMAGVPYRGDIMASSRPNMTSIPGTQKGYEVGIEVANQIVKALKKTTTRPVAQTL